MSILKETSLFQQQWATSGKSVQCIHTFHGTTQLKETIFNWIVWAWVVSVSFQGWKGNHVSFFFSIYFKSKFSARELGGEREFPRTGQHLRETSTAKNRQQVCTLGMSSWKLLSSQPLLWLGSSVFVKVRSDMHGWADGYGLVFKLSRMECILARNAGSALRKTKSQC